MVIPVHPEERLTANEYVIPIVVMSGVSSIIMLPIMIAITYQYMKNKTELKDKSAMFSTGLLYYLTTILFYINYAFRLLNYLKYGKHELDAFLINTTALLYGGHFTLLIILLFGRIYYVFHDTQYKLSLITLAIFFCSLIFGFIDVGFFGYAVLFDNPKMLHVSYLAGTFAIDFTIIWIAILYVYKLFQVIKSTSKHSIRRRNSVSSITSFSKTRSKSRTTTIESSSHKSNPNHALLVTITKYTVLSTVSIFISMFFWIIPYVGLTVNWFIYVVLYNAFMWLDITSNVMAFTMGYKFAHHIYVKLCQCPDSICRVCFDCLVFYAIRDKKGMVKQPKIGHNDSEYKEWESPKYAPKVGSSPPPMPPVKILELTSQVTSVDDDEHVINIDGSQEITYDVTGEIKINDNDEVVKGKHEQEDSVHL